MFLLPAPCRRKIPGRDLTAWMDRRRDARGRPPHRCCARQRPGVQRRSPSQFGDRSRARRAGPAGLPGAGRLAWDVRSRRPLLVLGNAEPAGSGRTIPATAWLCNSPGREKSVRRAGGDEAICVEPCRHRAVAGAGPEELLRDCVPEGHDRRDTLLALRLTGRALLEDRAAWERSLDELEPSLAFLGRDLTALQMHYEAEDLDRIDRAGGVLRGAAEVLRNEARDSALSEDQRSVAREALNRLYSWRVEEESQA